MAAHIDEIISCPGNEALAEPVHPDEPVLLAVGGDAKRFYIVKRDDTGEHVDEAFAKRNADDAVKQRQ